VFTMRSKVAYCYSELIIKIAQANCFDFFGKIIRNKPIKYDLSLTILLSIITNSISWRKLLSF